MQLKHANTMFDWMTLSNLLFFITQFCCGETGKVNGASLMLSSIQEKPQFYKIIENILHGLFCEILDTANIPTLPIPAGDSRFGNFSSSPAQFLNSVETPDFLDIYTKIFDIYIKFCFHLSPIFRLLPSNIGTVKKIETLQKRWRPIQCQLRQRTRNIM